MPSTVGASSRLDRAAEWIVARRSSIALALGAGAVALLWLVPQVSARLQVDSGGAQGSESAWVERALATRFGSPFASYAVLAIENIPSPDGADQSALRMIADTIARAPGVSRTLSYLDVRDSTFISPAGTFLLVGLSPDSGGAAGQIIRLRATTSRLRTQVRAQHPRAELSWTGAAAFDYDVRRTSAEDAAQAERRVLPIVLVVLVIVFGSAIAALLPLATGALAIGVSLGGAVLVSRIWPLTILLQNIVSMIGLGLGIDYALLMVSRFREAMDRGTSTVASAVEALRHAGHTIVISAMAVGIGFAALLLVPATELRSIAVGGLLVIAASMLIATLLLPGVLAALGRRIDIGRVRRKANGDRDAVRWRRWGHSVRARPLLVLIVAGAPLLALGWHARRLSTDIPSGSWLPERMESTRGARALQRMGRAALVQSLRVVVELPPGQGATTDDGWRAVLALSRAFTQDEHVARVRSLPLAMGTDRPSSTLLSMLPAENRSAFISRDEGLALIELQPRESASAGELVRYVHALRAIDAERVSGLAGVRIHVGGLPAFNADYEQAIGGSTRRVVALVIIGTFLALLVGFRSLLVPIKAIALNLLSVAAAMGAAVLVFQDGHGAGLLGLAAPVDGLFPAVPIIVFCIVFGLSMDYEVFLLARVAEFIDAGMSNDDAVVEGLVRTGGVITSAALVMVIVFTGFALGDFLVVKILGFALAAAVLIDATLVRMAIGPALLLLAGRWNWWPGRR